MRSWMRACTILLVIVAVSLAGHTAGIRAQSLVLSVVVVRPLNVHPGDRVWVSGDGFPPHRQVKLVYSYCPSIFLDTSGTGNDQPGPIADGKGQFTGYPYPAVEFAQVDRPLKCTVYATVGNNPFPDIPGIFYMLPTPERLNRCDKVQCGIKMSAHPARAHVGSQEAIGITGGWPGSRVAIVANVPGMPDLHRTVTLDWKGTAEMKMRAQAHLSGANSVKVRVRAQLRLGTATGNASGSFTIVR